MRSSSLVASILVLALSVPAFAARQLIEEKAGVGARVRSRGRDGSLNTRSLTGPKTYSREFKRGGDRLFVSITTHEGGNKTGLVQRTRVVAGHEVTTEHVAVRGIEAVRGGWSGLTLTRHESVPVTE